MWKLEDLHEKTVEFETEGGGTGFGTLYARENPEGLFAIQIRVFFRGESATAATAAFRAAFVPNIETASMPLIERNFFW